MSRASVRRRAAERLEARWALAGDPPLALADLYSDLLQTAPLNTVASFSATELIAAGSVWNYLVPENDPVLVDPDFASTWKLPAAEFAALYDGPLFFSGPGIIGYGDSQFQVTQVAPPPAGQRGAGYFRRELNLAAPAGNLQMDVVADDGLIVYLDGAPIGSYNMPISPGDHFAQASPALFPEDAYRLVSLTGVVIPAGAHTLAVSVHNSGVASADLSFDLRLSATTGIPGVLFNDSDADTPAGELTVLSLDGPAYGDLTLRSDGSFDYLPTSFSPTLSDSFRYQVSDGMNLSPPATVTLQFRPNGGVTPVRDYYLLTEDTTLATVGNAVRTLLPRESTWRYIGNHVPQGPTGQEWQLPGFDDGAWQTGPGSFGVFGGTFNTIVPPLDLDPSTEFEIEPNPTTYFRTEFNLSAAELASLSGDLIVELLRDSGAVLYLNGQEVLRTNMPQGPVDIHTLATAFTGGTSDYVQFVIPAAALQEGTNLLAAEVHRHVGPLNLNMKFDLALVESAAVAGLVQGVLANDAGPLSAVLVEPPQHGQFDLQGNGAFVYTPAAHYCGTDSFRYRAGNADG